MSHNFKKIMHDCCTKKEIINPTLNNYKLGQDASKIFTNINQAKYSRNKYTVSLSESNITNICTKTINLNININVDNINKIKNTCKNTG